MASGNVEELLNELSQAVSVLRRMGDTKWSNWLERDRQLIANGDFYGVQHLLGAFGGMGSFTDFASGGELEKSSGRIYEIAISLRRERERG